MSNQHDNQGGARQIENGRYRAIARGHAFGTAANGNPRIGIDFEFLEPGWEGHRMPYFGGFGEKELEHTVKALRACGWEGDELEHLTRDGFGTKECSVVVEWEQDERSGNWSPRIRWVNRLGGVGFKQQLEGGDLRAFSANMRGAIMGLEPGRRPSSPNRAAPQQQRAQGGNRQPPRSTGGGYGSGFGGGAYGDTGHSNPNDENPPDDIPF